MDFQIAWRLFKRELVQGQLILILLAITLAVMSVSGLSRVSERLQAAIGEQASQFIAADRIFSASKPIPDDWLVKARELGLNYTQSIRFNSVVFAGDEMLLVSVRAVEPGYPLKGSIQLDKASEQSLPDVDQVWVEGRVSAILGRPQALELGLSQFTIDNQIVQLPDGGFSLFNASPVVLMRKEAVDKTGILQPGSRVNYRTQFTGSDDALSAFDDFIKPLLSDVQRWQDVRSGESPIASSIRRAERFLLLASLLGIALACAAIGIAANRYCQRHFDVVAMLKTFGASKGQIQTIFVSHLGLVTALGVVLGLALGMALDMMVARWLPPELASSAPALTRPILLGVVTGFFSAFMFSAYPILRLLAIPPLRVIQRQLQGVSWSAWLNGLLSLLAMATLGYLYSQDLKLTLIVVACALLLGALLLIVGLGFIRLGHSIGLSLANPLQLAMASLRRRGRQNSVHLVGFSTALVLLLTILALRQDLLSDWQAQLPEGTPNYFLVNVAPDEVEPIGNLLDSQNIERTHLYPVIRGRLSQINTDELVARSRDEEQPREGRRGVGRELNLTYLADLPENNEIVAGEWQPTPDSVSLEQDFAQRMGIELGDVLTFQMDGRPVQVTVTSLRTLQWESLQPNFFVIFAPQALESFSATFIGSFHLTPEQEPLLLQLIRDYPTVSIIDVGAMVAQMRQIVDQVALSLSLVLAMVVAASTLVMLAQTEAGMAQRTRELAVLRTLGASGSLLRWATALEFGLLGALAGLLAVIVAEAALWLLKTQVFELAVQMHWDWWLIAPVLGAVVVASLGWWRTRHLLSQQCAGLLRAS
ncbi:ABC transporter permease [Paraferrimonas sedimenticola]|uniref:ABC transporter permease n=1 Tax=Paraferrimonas sedimenticola TaxID=375674 RepID=A0AA37RUJ8_9GAMM|nr:FtsX-like permease family protein [Paraferrimonas sedimenticola]GLP94822.1 ABC transporter permease [Paraferrimonas sedimenticola]